MLKNLLQESYRCFNKLHFLPKQLSDASLKIHNTISTFHYKDSYKSEFMNFSTSVSYPNDCKKKIVEIQRHEKNTPYIFFVKEQLKLDNYQGVSPTKRIKDLGERWSSMTENDKKPYINLALKNREELNQQKNNLLSQLNEIEIKNLKMDLNKEKIERNKKLKIKRIKKEKAKQNAPKRPKSAFILYCETLDRGDALRQDFLRGAAAKWKQIAEQDKKKFFDDANKLMEQYKKDYSQWESKMIEEGKKSLIRKITIETLNSKNLKKSKKKLI